MFLWAGINQSVADYATILYYGYTKDNMRHRTMYIVLNTLTKAVVGTYKSISRARSRADKLDSIYGSCIHVVKQAD